LKFCRALDVTFAVTTSRTLRMPFSAKNQTPVFLRHSPPPVLPFADFPAGTSCQREWKLRWANFPHRVGVALAKYHSVILVMRFYEHIASKLVDQVTLDRLTIDTFASAKRSAEAGKEGVELARDVFQTGWRANLISYLADYTVHEFILLFGYWVYLEQTRRQREKLGDNEDSNHGIHGGSIGLSILKNSILLSFSRGIGLFCSSFGGALGAMITPGWGSLAGANLGDGIAIALSEEIIGPSTAPALS